MRLAAHGGRNTGLGTGAVLGRQVWCQDRGIRVCLTLTCPEELRKFLPSYENFEALKSLIEAYVGVRSTYRISLTLLHKPPSYLQGPQASLPLRLGWTTWLLSKSSSLPTQEVVFGPHITARV